MLDTVELIEFDDNFKSSHVEFADNCYINTIDAIESTECFVGYIDFITGAIS